jgi:adenylate cyclase
VVLPFEDGPTRHTYFATGLTDEVISDLSRIKAIRVISRNTSMRLRGTTKDLRTIGQELKVKYALTGSVRRAGDALRITAELVDTESDTPVWAEKYSGSVSEVFALQERISRRIVDELQVTVTPEESKRLAVRVMRGLRVQSTLVQVQDAMYTTIHARVRPLGCMN